MQKYINIRDVIYNRIRRNRFLRHWGERIFSLPLIINNPIYKEIENELIVYKVKRLEKQPPHTLHIEGTNHCNAACVMCPNPIMNRIKGFMSNDIYNKVISEASGLGIKTVSIISVGEPFIDKGLVSRIQEAKKLGLRVVTSTNGSFLTTEMANAIIESGLDELDISFDGFTKETYENIRLGLSFEKVLTNINEFLRLREMKYKNRPRIMLRFIKVRKNYKEAELFLHYWKGRADDAIVSQAHDWSGGIAKDFRSRLHSATLRSVPCKSLWNEIMVHHDGNVVACCHDYEGTLVLGNIQHQSIAEIWHGKRMSTLRQAHLNRNLSSFPTCLKCHNNSIWWFDFN